MHRDPCTVIVIYCIFFFSDLNLTPSSVIHKLWVGGGGGGVVNPLAGADTLGVVGGGGPGPPRGWYKMTGDWRKVGRGAARLWEEEFGSGAAG